jgi:hypothetical protein
METGEFNKATWKPKFQSEFSMGEYDFKRFDLWLGRAELSSATINSCEVPNLELVQRYFSELNVLYKCWRSLISSADLKKELDESINKAKHEKRQWEQTRITGIELNKVNIFSLIDLLDSMHTKLLDIKQIIGLGIVVKKVMSPQEKIKYGLNVKKDFLNLPEA